MNSRPAPRPAALALALVAALALSSVVSAAQKQVDRSFDASTIRSIQFENLAGDLVLTSAASGEVRVHGTLFAERSARRSADELLGMLRLEMEQRGDRLVVSAHYPTHEIHRFRYPRREEHVDLPWFLDWLGDATSNLEYQGRWVRVTGASSSSAATLYADFRLEIPAGISINAKNLVGTIRSNAIAGDQKLKTSSGPIFASDGSGELVADTGSGDVVIENHAGSALGDTGSGDVTLRGVRGAKVAADTGSGDVDFIDCEGSIDADTGSGDVTGRNVVVGDRFRADTGSGDVRFSGDFAAVRDLYVDTGSGNVTLDLSAVPSLRLRVSTGSGDVEVDIPNMHVRRWKGDFIADIGLAEGNGTVDTGSGDVRIVQRGAN